MTKNVEYIIGLRDKFSPKLAKISANMKEMGSRMKDIGKTMSVALTAPLVILGGVAVKSFDTQVKAENKLRAALKANGEQVQAVFEDYKAWAAQIQEISTIGDESTLMLLQVAQSMGLTGDTAKVAAKEAIAMSRAMNMSEQSAIRYTAALALGDATMLRRYLPSLRSIEDQTEMVTEAHRILADMFGTVTAEAQDGLGPLIQLKNSWGDFMEMIGKVIAHGIKPLIDRLKGVVKWLQDLSPATKKWIVIIGGLVAALGPLMIALGFLMTTLIPGLIVQMTALFTLIAAHPIGALLVAIGLAIGIYLAFRKSTIKLTAAQKRLNEIKGKFNKILSVEQAKLEVVFNKLKNIKKGTKEHKKAIDEINTVYGKYLKNKLTEKTTIKDIVIAQKQATDGLIREIAIKAKQKDILRITTERIQIEKQALMGFTAELQKSIREMVKPGAAPGIGIRELAKQHGVSAAKITRAYKKMGTGAFDFSIILEDINNFYNTLKESLGEPIDIDVDADGIKKKAEKAAAAAAGITKITTAAPKVFNITIGNLIENYTISTTNLREGVNKSKEMVKEALLSALSDTQIAVR